MNMLQDLNRPAFFALDHSGVYPEEVGHSNADNISLLAVKEKALANLRSKHFDTRGALGRPGRPGNMPAIMAR